jgi:hypothetical protein
MDYCCSVENAVRNNVEGEQFDQLNVPRKQVPHPTDSAPLFKPTPQLR